MSLTLSLRRRPADVDDQNPQDDLPPIADGPHQTGTYLAARLASVGLLLCLALGPLALVVSLLAFSNTGSTPKASAPPVTDRSNEQATVGEFAQHVVVTWLTTTQDHPDALLVLVKDAQASTLPREPFMVADPAVARIVQVDGTWSVTVAATVTDARKVTARRFFQVPVRYTDGVVSALALPAAVSPPPVVPASSAEYREQMDATGAQGQTVAQFLAAYLTGAGDVGRYLTPGVTLAALTPAPYTSVRLDDLRGDVAVTASAPPDGQRLRVLAAATAVVTEQQSSSVTYALTLTARAGRWEISAIDPAPAYTPKAPAATSAMGPTPSSSERGSAPSGTSSVPRTP